MIHSLPISLPLTTSDTLKKKKNTWMAKAINHNCFDRFFFYKFYFIALVYKVKSILQILQLLLSITTNKLLFFCQQGSDRAMDTRQIFAPRILIARSSQLHVWPHGRFPDEERQRGSAISTAQIHFIRIRWHAQISCEREQRPKSHTTNIRVECSLRTRQNRTHEFNAIDIHERRFDTPHLRLSRRSGNYN